MKVCNYHPTVNHYTLEKFILFHITILPMPHHFSWLTPLLPVQQIADYSSDNVSKACLVQ
jgi:hypothetical protein